MKLERFRVKDFRSVIDTGWIECQNVTAFAGENESGKTTLLMALLKLSSVGRKEKDTIVYKSNEIEMSQIDLVNDIPIDRREELGKIEEIVFVQAEFEITEKLNTKLKALFPGFKGATHLVISRRYSGEYLVDILTQFPLNLVIAAKNIIIDEIPRFMYYKEVHEVDSEINLMSLALKLDGIDKRKTLTPKETIVSNLLDCLDIWETNLVKSIVTVYDDISYKNQMEVDFRKIFKEIPQFQARIERGFQTLTTEFRRWWGKDDVTISFEPYEKGIVIIILDEKNRAFRLENRSTGFRRFFALFLSFSISGREEYENAILLFDEAGAALHPLVQKQLANFFEFLGEYKQLMYNTHTAYMLPVANLNRARVVYKDDTGHTCISDTLRVNDNRTNELSLFPVQSSLALYIAEKAMAGCFPIIMLNESDENYFSIIRNILSAEGKLNTVYTILLLATGKNGIDAAAEAFSSGTDYPVIFLPSDKEGRMIKKRLLAGRYKKQAKKVFEISDFVPDAVKFEDLIPPLFIEIFSRKYLSTILDDKFEYDKHLDLLEQIETYAKKKRIALPHNYRFEIAKRMKLNTMKHFSDVVIPAKYLRNWKKIWENILK